MALLAGLDFGEGKDGIDVDGYRDYRGVPVIGAWTWLDKYGMGSPPNKTLLRRIDRFTCCVIRSGRCLDYWLPQPL